MNRRILAVALAYLASRTAMIMALPVLDSLDRGAVVADINLYAVWITRGIDATPLLESTWQYPPGFWVGLSPVELAPEGFRRPVIVLLLLAVDAAICAVLVRSSVKGRAAWPAPWFWIVGGFAVGPILFFRLDLLPAAAAVFALLAATSKRTGAWAGAGAALKLWPAVTLLSIPRRDTNWRSTLLSTAVAAALVTLLGIVLNPLTLVGVTNQAARGLQLESIAALPWQVTGLFDGHHSVEYSYGSFVVGDDLGVTIGRALTAVTAAAIAVVVWKWWRDDSHWGRGPDVVLVATVLLIATSRVFSPQFLIWIAAVAAVVAGGRGPLRSYVWWLLPAFVATGLFYVIGYEQVVELRGWPTALLVARNLWLVGWLIGAWIRLDARRTSDEESTASLTPATA